MLVNAASLDGLYTAFKTSFNIGMAGAKSYYRDVSMTVPSTARMETYAWLGAIAPIREWIGDRVIASLSLSSYTIKNRNFEATLGVQRVDIEDDSFGLLGPLFQKMGQNVELHPDELIFGLFAAGFTDLCYDGQPFFDADHPVGMPGLQEPVSVSNIQAGAGPAWFLIDGSQPLKPFIYQQRIPFEFQRLDNANENKHVFMTDEFIYGVRGRSNAGYGLWQLAFASKAALDTEHYEAAVAAMKSLKADNGKPLGVNPTHLVVPPPLEGDGRRLLKALNPDGGTNEWADSTKLVVTPWIS